MSMILHFSEHFKDTYFKFHDKDNLNIQNFIINKFHDNQSIHIHDLDFQQYEFQFQDDLLTYYSEINPILDDEDYIVDYTKLEKFHIYQNNKLFTTISNFYQAEDFDEDYINFVLMNHTATNNIYQNNNLIFTQHSNGDTTQFIYKKSQLIEQIYNDIHSIKYTYDKNNNLLTSSTNKLSYIKYEYNNKNQLMSTKYFHNDTITDHTSFRYDNNGNIISHFSKHSKIFYQYNKHNLITHISETVINNPNIPKHHKFNIDIEYDNYNYIKATHFHQPNNPSYSEFYNFNNDHILLQLSNNYDIMFKNNNLINNSSNFSGNYIYENLSIH